MAATAATNGGTFASDGTVGTIAITNPSNATSSDNSYATAILLLNEVSNYLKATNFGFSIPSGATINGILVEVEQKINAGSATENSIKIVKGGVISGDDQSTGATVPSTEAYVEYGGSTSKWGLTWTPADINLSTFGVVFSLDSSVGQAYIDHIRITVYYTTATTKPTYTSKYA